MDNRRRQTWYNYRRQQNRKPPQGNYWQRTIPSWEKKFCKEVGSMEWKTIVHMKKFTNFYINVINWNDSAGEEAFLNAKKRYWAQINNLPCDIQLPDPDLYIDEINWDSKTDPELQFDLGSEQVISNAEDHDHEPVIIFGDALLPNQAFSSTGWGDEFEDNLPANQCWEQNWGNPINGNASGGTGWGGEFQDNLPGNQCWEQNWGNPINGNTSWGTSWGDLEENLPLVPANQWEQNWGNPMYVNATGWPSYSYNAWNYNNPSGYMAWGGGLNNNDWGWSTYPNNNKKKKNNNNNHNNNINNETTTTTNNNKNNKNKNNNNINKQVESDNKGKRAVDARGYVPSYRNAVAHGNR